MNYPKNTKSYQRDVSLFNFFDIFFQTQYSRKKISDDITNQIINAIWKEVVFQELLERSMKAEIAND